MLVITSTPESRRTFNSKLAIWTHLEPKHYNLLRTSRSKYPLLLALLVLKSLIRKMRSSNGRFKTIDSRTWKQWINQDLLTTCSGSAEARGRTVNGADPHYTMVRRQHKVRIHLRGFKDPLRTHPLRLTYLNTYAPLRLRNDLPKWARVRSKVRLFILPVSIRRTTY